MSGDNGILEYSFEYNKGMTRTKNGLGHVEEYYYDSNNLIYKIIDANGGIIHRTYTEDEELEVNPEGLSTKYAFDENGRIIKLTDENNETTHYKYDDRGNLTSVVSPSGVRLTWGVR